MDIKIGDKASLSKKFSYDEVKKFSILSEDINPVHLNSEYAEKTIFKKPIVHGFLFGSLISAIIANKLPGPGSIYLGQEMKFTKPVYHNEVVTAEVKVLEIREDKNIYTLSTICYNNLNEVVLEGKAIVKLV